MKEWKWQHAGLSILFSSVSQDHHISTICPKTQLSRLWSAYHSHQEHNIMQSEIRTTAPSNYEFMNIIERIHFRNRTFLASQDALEVMRVTHSLTYLLTYWTLALTLLMWPWWVMITIEDFTDVTLGSEKKLSSEKNLPSEKKCFSDGSYRSKNSQRSEKEWWLVTFRLWRC